MIGNPTTRVSGFSPRRLRSKIHCTRGLGCVGGINRRKSIQTNLLAHPRLPPLTRFVFRVLRGGAGSARRRAFPAKRRNLPNVPALVFPNRGIFQSGTGHAPGGATIRACLV